MTIQRFEKEKMRHLVKRCFPEENRTLLLEQADFTRAYAIQFQHDEAETFLAMAESMAHYFASSVVVSLYDRNCYCHDCEVIENCISRRASFHEMAIVENKEQSGSITVIAAAVVSHQLQSIDYFIHLVSHK